MIFLSFSPLLVPSDARWAAVEGSAGLMFSTDVGEVYFRDSMVCFCSCELNIFFPSNVTVFDLPGGDFTLCI